MQEYIRMQGINNWIKRTITVGVLSCVMGLASAHASDTLKDLPEDKTPEVIGKRIARKLLKSKHKLVFPRSYPGILTRKKCCADYV
ncbi:hypothetical protein ACFL3F_05795 [Planctomycetota bacterium]